MLIVALLVVANVAAFANDPQVDTPVLPENTYLVKARVLQVNKKTTDAEFVIESVFVGDPALKGQKFILSDYLWRPGSIQGKPLFLPLLAGEVGLWWVGRPDAAHKKLFCYNDLWHGLPDIYTPFPAILSGGPDPTESLAPRLYGDLKSNPEDFGPKRMIEWTEAIQKVCETAGDERRITLLENYVHSDNPPLAAWALNTLSRFLEPEFKGRLFDSDGKPRTSLQLLLEDRFATHVRKDVKRFLEGYADNPKLPIYAQTELDRILTRVDDGWLKSEQRSKMVQRWEKIKDPVDRYFIDAQLKHQGAAE